MIAANSTEDVTFVQYLQDLGNGQIKYERYIGVFKIKLPPDLQLEAGNLAGLCEYVFESLHEKHQNSAWLADRAIICPTNEAVQHVNEYMTRCFPGQERFYKSSDKVGKETLYPIEFINRLNPSGFPSHILSLKKRGTDNAAAKPIS